MRAGISTNQDTCGIWGFVETDGNGKLVGHEWKIDGIRRPGGYELTVATFRHLPIRSLPSFEKWGTFQIDKNITLIIEVDLFGACAGKKMK